MPSKLSGDIFFLSRGGLLLLLFVRVRGRGWVMKRVGGGGGGRNQGSVKAVTSPRQWFWRPVSVGAERRARSSTAASSWRGGCSRSATRSLRAWWSWSATTRRTLSTRRWSCATRSTSPWWRGWTWSVDFAHWVFFKRLGVLCVAFSDFLTHLLWVLLTAQLLFFYLYCGFYWACKIIWLQIMWSNDILLYIICSVFYWLGLLCLVGFCLCYQCSGFKRFFFFTSY